MIELLQGLLFCLTARPTTRWRTEDFDFATLVHVRAKGDCLTPYFDDGDLLFVAQGLAPQHRELVLVDIGFYSPGGLGSPPSTTWRRMVKQFIVDDAGVAWVANNSDAVPARLHRVKGVVVAYKRRRHWLRPSVRRMDFSANVRSGLQGRDQDGHGLVG